jgi:lipid-A-disaccharide synthase
MKTVMIVSGESSGEFYGALLAGAIRSIWPDVRIIGIGGERMKAAGVEMMSGISSALGLTEMIPSIKKLRMAFRAATKALTEASPDVVVLIDYPDFNFKVGRVAKKLGIKVLYYVSPQLWAWRKGRVRTMAKFVDRIAVLLPFEEEIYKRVNIPCEFVGHPVMEEIEEYEKNTRASIRTPNSEPPQAGRTPVIALLPGSRPNEMKTLLPVFIELVKVLKSQLPDCRFMLPLAPNIEAGRFDAYLNMLKDEGVVLVKGETIKTLASSDAAVIASGTATFQAALLGIPTVVVYKLSWLSYLTAKAVIDVKYIALVNIIMNKGIFPELIQHRANAGEIAEELKKILFDPDYRDGMASSLNAARNIFAGKRPSRRVAEMIGEMAAWEH